MKTPSRSYSIIGRAITVIAFFLPASALCQESAVESAAKMKVVKTPLRNLNSYFPFRPPASVERWKARKEQLRRHLLVSLGLWPMPEVTQPKPVIHGTIDLGEYTIDKVYFETIPGLFCTGNLYQPKNRPGKLAAILCPHGHHRDGRFRKASDKQIDEQVAKGAEKFRSNARSPLQARCAHLAKMGCVVFHYDMLGYADSQQIGYDIAHGFSKQRAEMNDEKNWGLFSPRAESHLQHVMGLQTFNSLQALKFIEALPNVDSKRIGVTGASGGGTQTFVLCAISDKPAVSFPAVMVSTTMQGGCTCENCSYLRIGTGNVEIAAMFAPKPMGLTTANDWTQAMPTQGFPELKKLYTLLNAPENVQLTDRPEFEHNYNQVSREAMYAWFAKHLALAGPVKESEVRFLERDQLTVFDKDHPRPAPGEQKILANWNQLTVDRLQSEWKNDGYPALSRRVGAFVEVVNATATVTDGVWKPRGEMKPIEPNSKRFVRTWRNKHGGLALSPTYRSPNNTSHVLLLNRNPEQLDSDLGIALIAAGFNVSSFDNQSLDSESKQSSPSVNNSREALAYTSCYNPPQLALRANAWLPLLTHNHGKHRKQFVIATDETSLEVALNAAAIKNSGIAGIVVKTAGFRFENIENIRHPDLLPGGARYFDLPGLLALAAPTPMLVIGEDPKSISLLIEAYKELGAEKAITVVPVQPNGAEDLIVKWIEK